MYCEYLLMDFLWISRMWTKRSKNVSQTISIWKLKNVRIILLIKFFQILAPSLDFDSFAKQILTKGMFSFWITHCRQNTFSKHLVETVDLYNKSPLPMQKIPALDVKFRRRFINKMLKKERKQFYCDAKQKTFRSPPHNDG